MPWVGPAYLLMGPLSALRIVLFCRINYMVTFPKTFGETGDFFPPEVGRKVEPLRRVVLTGHRALHHLPESSLKFHGDTVGTFQNAARTTERRIMKYPDLCKKSSVVALRNGHICQRPGGEVRKSVTNQKIKLKSAGLVSLQSLLLSGIHCMRACVIMGSNLSSATHLQAI